MMEKTVDYYMSLPYTIELHQDPEEGWFVSVRELPGCMSQGDTAAEAVEMIRDAMTGWIEVALEDGDPVPEPRPLEDYSGKFVVRVPRSLHRDLVESAERDGVSLNRYINVALGRSVGRPDTTSCTTETDEVEWPGLKAAVCQALLAAGLNEEAGELDEQMFASQMRKSLAQVEAALDGGYLRDALWELEAMDHTLCIAARKSPILDVLSKTVRQLHRQVQMLAEIQQGLMHEVAVRSRISGVVQKSALGREVIKDVSVGYSVSTSEMSSSSTREQTDLLFRQAPGDRPAAKPRW
jgi:antitoxin HicB